MPKGRVRRVTRSSGVGCIAHSPEEGPVMKTLLLSIVIIVVAGLLFPMVVGAQRGGRPPWLKKEGVYLATSSETIPLFAGVLAGYRDAGNMDFWDRPFTFHGTIRIFEGTDWAGIPEFPNSGKSLW